MSNTEIPPAWRRQIQLRSQRFSHEGSSQASGGLAHETGALRDSFDFFHNSGRNLHTAALIALAAYECAELIIEDYPLRLYSAGLVVLGTVALPAIIKDWRRRVYCFVAWIAVEDLMIVYFAKVPVRQASWRRCFSAFHDENGIHPGPTRVAVERLIGPAFSSIHGAGSR